MSQAKRKTAIESGSDKVVHSYHDHANEVEEESTLQNHLVELSLYRPADQNFTARLHRLLTRAEQEGIAQIISWMPHGRSFLVHDKQQFELQVMPRWFQQSSMSSFLRQLNLYGFMRLHKGPDKGGYYHELFLRSKPTLCRRIERTRIKGRGARRAVSHHTEPDFYQMTPLPSDNTNQGVRPPTEQSVSGRAALALAPRLPTSEPGEAALAGLTAQQESQQTALLQQLGLWQSLGGVGNEQPLPALSSAATLPHVDTSPPPASNQRPMIETHLTNSATSGPQPLPSGIQAVDNSSLFRCSLSIPQGSTTSGLLQSDFILSGGAGGSQASSSSLSTSLNQQFAAIPSPQAESGDVSGQHAALSPASQNQQQQSFLDSSNATSLRNTSLPGFLASLFEPTPFPQLPSHPPAQAQAHQQTQQQQSSTPGIAQPQPQQQALPPQEQLQQNQCLFLGGEPRQQVPTSSSPRLLAIQQNQILQSRSPSSGDLSHHFAGIHPSLAASQSLRFFPSPTTEENKEASRGHHCQEEGKDANRAYSYQADPRRNEEERQG